MDSKSIYTTLPYTYLIGWSDLDLYYYGRRTAAGCNPSDLFESYFTSSDEVESYVSEYGSPDVIKIRRTFDTVEECCRWECTVLRRLDAKNNDRFLNKTNGDSEWIYSGIDAVWMNRQGKNRRVRREHIENYRDMGWTEGRAVDWVWIKKDGGWTSTCRTVGYLGDILMLQENVMECTAERVKIPLDLMGTGIHRLEHTKLYLTL